MTALYVIYISAPPARVAAGIALARAAGVTTLGFPEGLGLAALTCSQRHVAGCTEAAAFGLHAEIGKETHSSL